MIPIKCSQCSQIYNRARVYSETMDSLTHILRPYWEHWEHSEQALEPVTWRRATLGTRVGTTWNNAAHGGAKFTPTRRIFVVSLLLEALEVAGQCSHLPLSRLKVQF